MGVHTKHTKPGPHLPELLLRERKRVHECLGDHWQTAIYVRRLLNVKDELGVLQDVDPKAKRKAVPREISFQKLPFLWRGYSVPQCVEGRVCPCYWRMQVCFAENKKGLNWQSSWGRAGGGVWGDIDKTFSPDSPRYVTWWGPRRTSPRISRTDLLPPTVLHPGLSPISSHPVISSWLLTVNSLS